MDLILLRHGETALNRKGVYQGPTLDPPLTQKGREQAEAAARGLAPILRERGRIGFYTSPMQRARQTAMPLAKAIGQRPQVLDWLTEFHYGHWEGLTVEEIKAAWPGEYELWQKHPDRMAFKGGETLAVFRERLRKGGRALLKAHEPGDTLVFVAHSGVVRMLVMDALGMPLRGFRRLVIPHTGLARLSGAADGKWGLSALGAAPGEPAF